MARLETFCIDRYEAHLVVRTPSGALEVHSPFSRPEENVEYAARSAANVVPQAYINRLESRAACEHAGKRLCRLSEWYAACVGPERFTYPYGNQEIQGRCNTGKPHLLTRLYGPDARAWDYEKHFNDPNLNQEPGFLAKTGEHSECVSAHGVYDLVGNLHEWVSDTVSWNLPQKVPLNQAVRGSIGRNLGNAIFMGGFFSTHHQLGRGCRFLTPGHGARYHDYSTGFRCCADVKGAAPSP